MKIKKMDMDHQNQTEILCAGQAVIDCVTRGIETDPAGRRKTRAESIVLRPGGDAFNEAAVLAGLGRSVSLCCAVGEDAAGRLILEEAKRRGIRTDGVSIRPELQTVVADIFVAKDGSRSSISSEASRLPGYEPNPVLITESGCRIVTLASLFRAPWDRPEAVLPFVQAAKEAGAMVLADTKLPTFRKTAFSDLREVWPMIDWFLPNEEEALFYAGASDIREAAETFLYAGVGHVVIKCGAKGVFAADEEGSFALPAVPVTAVDTTGAGDSFAAGFLDAVLDGRNFRDACAAGLASAADCVGHGGV